MKKFTIILMLLLSYSLTFSQDIIEPGEEEELIEPEENVTNKSMVQLLKENGMLKQRTNVVNFDFCNNMDEMFDGYYYAVSYEKLLGKHSSISFRLGNSYSQYSDPYFEDMEDNFIEVTGLSSRINFFTGGDLKLIIGFGYGIYQETQQMYSYDETKRTSYSTSWLFGFRYQVPDGRIVLNLGLSVDYGIAGVNYSFGYRF